MLGRTLRLIKHDSRHTHQDATFRGDGLCLHVFALFTVVSGIFAYWYARKITQIDYAEVWLQAQALWIMRNIVIYSVLAILLRFGLFPYFSSPGIAIFG